MIPNLADFPELDLSPDCAKPDCPEPAQWYPCKNGHIALCSLHLALAEAKLQDQRLNERLTRGDA